MKKRKPKKKFDPVARAMIMDRDWNVVFLDQLVQHVETALRGISGKGTHTQRFTEFEYYTRSLLIATETVHAAGIDLQAEILQALHDFF